MYLYGKNPLKEAVLYQTRTKNPLLVSISFTKQAALDADMVSLLQKSNLTYSVLTVEEIEAIVGRGVVHQGVVARIDETYMYKHLDEVLAHIAKSEKQNPVILLLDELQDPHNVGAIIRSAVAFGVSAIVLPEHNQADITATVIKASSGMIFSIPIVHITNVNTTLRNLKEKGFWTYGLTAGGDTIVQKAVFDTPSVIVVGSEGKGLRHMTEEICDFKLSIKTSPLCESLNASNAVAVVLYEWNKQQR